MYLHENLAAFPNVVVLFIGEGGGGGGGSRVSLNPKPETVNHKHLGLHKNTKEAELRLLPGMYRQPPCGGLAARARSWGLTLGVRV